MAAAKKKPKIQASEIAVDNRSLLGVLADLAEQVKANDERCSIALQTIAAVSQDLRAITQELRTANARVVARLDALETH